MLPTTPSTAAHRAGSSLLQPPSPWLGGCCRGAIRVPLGSSSSSSACQAYFPHHRQYVTRSGGMLPRSRHGRRRPMLAPEREPPVTDQAASWLLSGQWLQQVAVWGPEALQRAQSGAQALCLVLAAAQQHAQAVWQYVLAQWPAWRASLQEDAEIVFEYACGLIPAWLALLHASIVQLCQQAAAWEPVQQVASAAVAAAAAAESSAVAVTEAAQQKAQQVAQLIAQQLAPGPSPSAQPPAVRRAEAEEQEDHHQVRRGSRQEAAKVAYSIAWFGLFGRATGAQHLAVQQQQEDELSQQMSLEEWQQLHQQQLYEAAASEPARMSRWRRPQRREWMDGVVSRARKANSSSSGQQQQQHHHIPARDHVWRSHHHEGPVWAAPARHVAGALQAAQQGVCGCVEAVQSTGRAAVGGVQRAGVMLVTPVQHAVQRVEPPPAGMVAAGVVLLAGAVASSVMRRQQEAAVLAQQQRVAMKQSAEELRAQKARIMGVLSVEVPSAAGAGGASKRKGAAAAATATARTSIPVTVAGSLEAAAEAAAAADEDDEDDAGAEGAVRPGMLREVEMDPEAAAMWKQFLAGSRAMNVPMWDNKMVSDLPKVSRKEVDKQTQKIRTAAAPEERAALEEADMAQLSRQLQALDHAPIGRKARAAWLKEKKQQPQKASADSSEQQQQAGAEGAASKGASDSSNPFAISAEVRAQWDSDLDEQPAARAAPPPPRKPISSSGSAPAAAAAPAAPAAASSSSTNASTTNTSQSGSRAGQRSRSPADAAASGGGSSGSSNPFALSGAVRAQWEAEDHLFTEAPKPLLGNVLGNVLTALTSGSVQPPQVQQHQQRRRQALKAEEAEAAAMLRLAQLEQQTQQQQQLNQTKPGAAAMKPAAAPQAGAAPAAPAAAAASTAEVLQEGSPEWSNKVRQDMMRNGAARRARMQQQQQRPQAAAAAPQPSSLGSSKATPAASSDSSSSLAAISAADAQGVTAAIPNSRQPASTASPAQPTQLAASEGHSSNTPCPPAAASGDANSQAVNPQGEAGAEQRGQVRG